MPSDRENRLGIFAVGYTDEQLRTMGFNDVGLRDEAVIIGEPSTWGELQATSVMDDLRAGAEALRRNDPSDAENARRIAEAAAVDVAHAIRSVGRMPPGYGTDCSCTRCVMWRRDMAAALPRQHYVMHSGDFHVGDVFEPAINLTEEQVRLARRRMEVGSERPDLNHLTAMAALIERQRMEVDYVELAPRRDTIGMVAASDRRARERKFSTPVAADWQPNAWEA